MKSYSELFQSRGSSYDTAMRNFPRARRAEFLQIFDQLEMTHGMRIGDVPAGGGYMRMFLPETVQWEGHEPCTNFRTHSDVASDSQEVPFLPLPWQDQRLDAVLSLAGVHHVEDKVPLFAEVARVVKPGGSFVLSDVAADTPTARFLDGFVGDHNSTGHTGAYLCDGTLDELRQAAWQIVSSDLRCFAWEFASREEMGEFTWLMFDIRKSNPAKVAQAIDRELGVTERPDGTVAMNWSLMTITCRLPAA